MKIKLAAVLMLCPSLLFADDGELIERGEKVFKKCKACHKIGDDAKNGVGPALNNIYGRGIAADPDFRYSAAMAGASGQTWDQATLEAFLAAPAKVIPGTKMSFRGLTKPEDITAIIELLKAN